MGESELEVLKTILSNTDSVIVVLFVLVILFLVIAFIPIYKLILQSRVSIANNENDRMDLTIKREALIIEVITKNTVNKVEGDNSRIEIVFVNSVGDKLLYKLSKERVKLSDEAYEVMAIKEMTGYYYERENTNNLVLDYGEEGTVSIQMEAQALEKKDLVWIAKNIVSIYR